MVEVRPVRADEWAALRELRLRALATDPDAFGSTLAQARELPDEAWQERAAGGPGLRTFVAEQDGELVAMTTGFGVSDDSDTLLVVGVWTAPEVRGRGVARALVEAVLDWARESGFTTARLFVNEDNPVAASVYAGLGFVATGGRLAHPNRPGIDELEMVRDL